MLIGQLTPTEGSVRLGANVNIGYYAQNQDDLMDGEFTVYDTLDRVAVGDIRTRLRDILGAFLFRGEDIDKKVKVLSGGERARLAMARMMLEPRNLLILDEPTNHMDMRSKDILKNAIMKYDGTVVVVSHDREFLDGMVQKVYEFRDGGVKEYLGGIYYFLEKRKLESLQEIERRDAPAKRDGESRGEIRRAARCEQGHRGVGETDLRADARSRRSSCAKLRRVGRDDRGGVGRNREADRGVRCEIRRRDRIRRSRLQGLQRPESPLRPPDARVGEGVVRT